MATNNKKKQGSKFEKQAENEVWHKPKQNKKNNRYITYESQRNVGYHKNKEKYKEKIKQKTSTEHRWWWASSGWRV